MHPLNTKEKIVFWLGKAVSMTLTVVIPGFVVGWTNALLGVLIVHLTLGYVLSLIFQLAHEVEGLEFPVPNDENHIEEEWAIHQVRTTANFANKSKFLNWYCGGLNFQIEHHLFPRICHVHYSKIAKIVEQTCKEFSLPYVNHPTFVASFTSHVRNIHRLGTQP
jgi:linoleoyl-CoA desaturase